MLDPAPVGTDTVDSFVGRERWIVVSHRLALFTEVPRAEIPIPIRRIIIRIEVENARIRSIIRVTTDIDDP